MPVRIRARQCATKRTRERIQQHGPEFTLQREEFCHILGCMAVLVVTKTRGWFGWIPKHEVEMEVVNGVANHA